MGVIITAIITGILITIVLWRTNGHQNKTYNGTLEKIGELFGIFFASCFISVISISIGAFFVVSSIPTEEKPYHISELVSLKDNKNLNGSFGHIFFVGGGSINENYYYCFYYKTNNGIKFKKVYAETNHPPIYLIERNNRKPQYIRYGTFYKKEYREHWLYKHFCSKYYLDKTRDVLYIPEGSILTNYKLDAE